MKSANILPIFSLMGCASAIQAAVGEVFLNDASLGAATYVGCVGPPSGWVRPYGNVAISAAGAESCQTKCRNGGYTYFGLECPMSSQVHCQCSNGGGGTSRDASYCRGQGNPLVHPHGHCVGPYEAGGYLFGDYVVSSVYYTSSTTPSLVLSPPPPPCPLQFWSFQLSAHPRHRLGIHCSAARAGSDN